MMVRPKIPVILWLCLISYCFQILLIDATRTKRKRSTPDYLIELYHKFHSGSVDLDEEEQDSNKIYTIYPTGKSNQTNSNLPQNVKLKFNVSSLQEEDRIIGAHLRLFVERLNTNTSTSDPDASQSDETQDYRNTNADISGKFNEHTKNDENVGRANRGKEIILIIKTTCTTMIKKTSDGFISFGTRWRHTKLLTRSNTGRWTKLKVTSAERTLNSLRRYREIFHFEVWCTISTQSPTDRSNWKMDSVEKRDPMPILSSKSDKEPSLVVYISNNKTRPFRRMVEMNQKERNLVTRDLVTRDLDPSTQSGYRGTRNYFSNRGCHHQDFHLDFKKIGWDNKILYPDEMNIRRCVGRCPFPMSNNIAHSTHAFMQARWNARFPEEIRAPCCASSGYMMNSLIIYGSEENVYIKSYEDMVITSCYCG